ncbi:deleted in malignant brain tumors 1 protein-like [Mercenaria mercenaria]|uniref:deleted in malignant brain tumors 1 protein-like n=1 Tax=Mercenaria mercenaria TaxID=6596 RepID=UPI00234EBE25|nr:deleted in malignant brain tumors 1 protein-like [Mercenaria mercenaria]
MVCLNAAEVRLVGGRTPYEGRLEMRKSNKEPWGTVCDDNFDDNDARVVCRMLGFRNSECSSVVEASAYGPGSGKILLDEMQCIGNESDVSQCKANTWGQSDCAHAEDVGVSCQTPVRLVEGPHSGRIEIQRNGSWGSICLDSFNQTVGKVICRMLALSTGDIEIRSAGSTGTLSPMVSSCVGNEKDIALCQMSKESCRSARSTSIDCRTEVRLVGGPNQQLGRVEVNFQDKWGTVCDDSFDDNAASVICRMLGYNPKGARARGRAFYGKGNGSVTIDELRCSGDETDISECKSNYWGSHTNCDHDEDASVECGTEVRLVDGPTRFSGRLEIKLKSSWNTMCDDSFNNKTASVVCRMLGFERGNISVRNNDYFGKSTGEITHYRLECLGNETDIVNCKHTDINSCNSGSNVGVNCYSVTPVRLQGGPTTYSGRVEVYMQELSTWMGICDESYGFTVDDARVLCRMIGKPNMNPSFHTATYLYDYVIRGKAISDMNCSGYEQDITNCRSGQQWLDKSCGYPNYVGINCEPVTKVRLVEGPSTRAGRVEIQYNGTWGTICMDEFDTVDSDVICNMLGYTQKSYLLKRGEYKQGNISKTITNAQCKGKERDISDCKADPWMSGNCPSGFDVGIVCSK